MQVKKGASQLFEKLVMQTGRRMLTKEEMSFMKRLDALEGIPLEVMGEYSSRVKLCYPEELRPASNVVGIDLNRLLVEQA